MEDVLNIFQNYIIWPFALVILLGGQFWGSKYFPKAFKNPATNFLAFATIVGILWVIMGFVLHTYNRETIPGLIITYLFTTSFYELIGKKVLGFFANSTWGKNKAGQE